ncbi:MAG: hypothetical protein U9R72_00465 [Chloroflexota bacterium]|nr:hypothetical protein [Chloroflexota bacterium]
MRGWRWRVPGDGGKVRFVVRVALVVFVLGAASSIARADDAESGTTTVVGEVSNETPGGVVPDGLEVTLHVFAGIEELEVYTTTLAAGQGFGFQQVSIEAGQTLVARTVHEGVRYVSEAVTVEGDEEEVWLPVTVYEATDDPDGVAVAQLHLFLERVGERLEVGQYVVVRNGGSRTYVGSSRSGWRERATWAVTLPDGAEGLRFEGGEAGERFLLGEDGFADTRAIRPGEASVEASFTYELAYSEGMRIEEAFDIPVESFVVVVLGESLGLEGAGLSAEGSLETQMGPAVSYTGGPLDADEPLSFRVVGRGMTASGAQAARRGEGLAVGIAVLAVCAAAATRVWRSPVPRAVPGWAEAEVEAMAALDRDFERGRVSETVYEKRRRALKRELRERLLGS